VFSKFINISIEKIESFLYTYDLLNNIMPCGNCGIGGHNRRTCHVQTRSSRRHHHHKKKHMKCGEKNHPWRGGKNKTLTLGAAEELKKKAVVEVPTCAICLDAVGEARAVLKCGHTYCTECLMTHATTNNKCPQCRSIMIHEKMPLLESLKFVFIQSADAYINVVRGNPSPHWRGELSSIVLTNILAHFSRVNLAIPSPITEDGSTANWLIELISLGVDDFITVSGAIPNEPTPIDENDDDFIELVEELADAGIDAIPPVNSGGAVARARARAGPTLGPGPLFLPSPAVVTETSRSGRTYIQDAESGIFTELTHVPEDAFRYNDTDEYWTSEDGRRFSRLENGQFIEA